MVCGRFWLGMRSSPSHIWAGIGIRNGELLAAAERERFDLLITSDQGFPHQQNMEGRKLAVLLVPTPDWNAVKVNVPQIETAIRTSSPGTFVRVSFGPLE